MDFINFVIGLMGVSFFASGVGFAFLNIKQRSGGLRLKATIKEVVEKKRSEKSQHKFYPVFSFYVEGRLRELTHYAGSKTPKYKAGQEIEIIYSPKREIAIIKGDMTNTIITLVYLAIGALMIFAALTI